ncbi:hypothetical protein NDU88_003684 [Pleurodeles waltl]|uniref:Uncharacterized protein n=1 Tax=Pleurodeles waltl TaxID=8319 RepID=A0AAV7LJ73_PLEWA|nr:hypothetical protein NDU88_003684 [Pleurodeles waltl]
MPVRPFQRRRTEEPTGEWTTGTGGEHEEATAGGFWRYREEDGSEDLIPSRSRPLDKDCWHRGTLALDLPRFRRSVAKSVSSSCAQCVTLRTTVASLYRASGPSFGTPAPLRPVFLSACFRGAAQEAHFVLRVMAQPLPASLN